MKTEQRVWLYAKQLRAPTLKIHYFTEMHLNFTEAPQGVCHKRKGVVNLRVILETILLNGEWLTYVNEPFFPLCILFQIFSRTV